MKQYEKLVKDIGEIAESHYFIKDFGYGSLSDIKVRSEQSTERSADYPYLFINPVTHTRRISEMSYNFNFICMSIVNTSDDFLKIQSECTEYLDDVLASLKLDYKHFKYILGNNITYTVFKERFQDEVAGVTMNLTITIPKVLDYCNSPSNQ